MWTAPTGKTYTTLPGSRLFFPAWNTTTADLPTSSTPPPGSGRAATMPIRKRTRAAEELRRIKAERALNDAHIAERNMPPPF